MLDLVLIYFIILLIYNYEKLEFVGDVVVWFVVAELLFENYFDCLIGEFVVICFVLVSDCFLVEIVNKYGWNCYLLVFKSVVGDKVGEEFWVVDFFEVVLVVFYLSIKNL